MANVNTIRPAPKLRLTFHILSVIVSTTRRCGKLRGRWAYLISALVVARIADKSRLGLLVIGRSIGTEARQNVANLVRDSRQTKANQNLLSIRVRQANAHHSLLWWGLGMVLHTILYYIPPSNGNSEKNSESHTFPKLEAILNGRQSLLSLPMA